MNFLLALAARLGVPEPFRRLAAIGATVLGIAAAFALLVRCHDARVVADHDARTGAATANADRRADAAAADARRADDARLAQERTQIEGVSTDANSPVDARVARLRCIRLQQDARAAGREPPACGGPRLPGGAARAK